MHCTLEEAVRRTPASWSRVGPVWGRRDVRSCPCFLQCPASGQCLSLLGTLVPSHSSALDPRESQDSCSMAFPWSCPQKCQDNTDLSTREGSLKGGCFVPLHVEAWLVIFVLTSESESRTQAVTCTGILPAAAFKIWIFAAEPFLIQDLLQREEHCKVQK